MNVGEKVYRVELDYKGAIEIVEGTIANVSKKRIVISRINHPSAHASPPADSTRLRSHDGHSVSPWQSTIAEALRVFAEGEEREIQHAERTLSQLRERVNNARERLYHMGAKEDRASQPAGGNASSCG